MSHRRGPQSELIRQMMIGQGVSRRGFLRGASLASLAVAAPALLSACGTEGAQQAEGECESTDKSDTEKTLNFSNWPLYIDEKKVKRNGKKETVYPTLEKFQDASGIEVEYGPADEPWGVRRFFVRDPFGKLLNILQHQ